MTKPFAPPPHRPVVVCSHCGDAWPCGAERSLVAAREAARAAVRSSLDAALLVKNTRDVPQESPAGEPESGLSTAPGSTNQLEKRRTE